MCKATSNIKPNYKYFIVIQETIMCKQKNQDD